jgi:hypothetical protein
LAAATEMAVDVADVEGCVNWYGMTPMTHASSLSWIIALDTKCNLELVWNES